MLIFEGEAECYEDRVWSFQFVAQHSKHFVIFMLKNGFDKAVITQNSQTTKLVSKENIILSERANQTHTPWYKHPLFVFGVIALV